MGFVFQQLQLLLYLATGNLDQATGTQVLALLRELNDAGQTVLMVTHDVRAVRYARRTVNHDQPAITRSGLTISLHYDAEQQANPTVVLTARLTLGPSSNSK